MIYGAQVLAKVTTISQRRQGGFLISLMSQRHEDLFLI